jgi:hypothetical protein
MRKQLAIAIAALLAGGPILAPQLLAFPHHESFGADQVWSVAPIDRKAMAEELAHSASLIAKSPIARGEEGRRIFLTDGGWRWYWLANSAAGGFALTRPINDAIVFNRTDPARGLVFNGDPLTGQRRLGAVIAHEKTHGMLRRHFGFVKADLVSPQWLREGYCDHVAGESSLSDAAAAGLKAQGKSHPALPYYEGRRKVAALLAANGNNVDRLFDEAR